MNSLYQTAMTFAGQNVGAEKIERVKRIGVIAFSVVVVTGLLIGGICLIFGEELLSIYIQESDPELQELVMGAGMLRLEIICTTYFMCGVMEVLSGLMRGMGKPVIPMIVSILGSCILRIVWIAVVCNVIFPGQIIYLYIAYPVTWLITSSAHLICCCKTYKLLLAQRNSRRALEAEANRLGIMG